MFENDWLSRQIDIISRSLSVLLMKRDSAFNMVEEEAESKEGLTINEETLLMHMLKKYINEGKYNEAENLLFDDVESNRTEQKLQIALWFYDELSRLNETVLKNGNFSREEILQGLSEIKRLYTVAD